MYSLVINLAHVMSFNGSRLTGLTCSKAPGFWMVEHQLVYYTIATYVITYSECYAIK